jgi:multidrug efflux pump subunit AcrA (membrane-fusion protein)
MNFMNRFLVLIAISTASVPALDAQRNDKSAIRLPVTLEGDQRTELHARVEGYVAEIHVDIGDRVTKGQLLITLDAPELESDVRRRKQMLMQAQANLGVAKGRIAVAEAKISQAESSRKEQAAMRQLRISERDRYAALVRGGAVQREKLEEAEYGVLAVEASVAQIDADVLAAKADVMAAKNEVAFAESGIEVAKAELAWAATQDKLRQIIAPFDGIIADRDVDAGQLVSSGDASRSPLLVIENVNILRGVVSVPADESGRVQLGDLVTLTGLGQTGDVKSRDGGPLVVSRVSQSLNKRTRTMRVEIDIKNLFDKESGRYQFLSGQYGSASLKTKR